MSDYRRANFCGGYYFFTVVTYKRRKILTGELARRHLRHAFEKVRSKRNYKTIAFCLLPEHLHCIWKLPEGDGDFSGLLAKIEMVCQQLSVPVIVKEVGWGISERTARQLAEAGVSAIDVAGAGGTSWSQVEMHRAIDPYQARLAAAFIDWGIPTTQSLINVQRAAPGMITFASGGVRDGIDIAKSIALGASLGGLASPFLKAANESLADTIATIQLIHKQIQVAMFVSGAADITRLKSTPLDEY